MPIITVSIVSGIKSCIYVYLQVFTDSVLQQQKVPGLLQLQHSLSM